MKKTIAIKYGPKKQQCVSWGEDKNGEKFRVPLFVYNLAFAHCANLRRRLYYRLVRAKHINAISIITQDENWIRRCSVNFSICFQTINNWADVEKILWRNFLFDLLQPYLIGDTCLSAICSHLYFTTKYLRHYSGTYKLSGNYWWAIEKVFSTLCKRNLKISFKNTLWRF